MWGAAGLAQPERRQRMTSEKVFGAAWIPFRMPRTPWGRWFSAWRTSARSKCRGSHWQEGSIRAPDFRQSLPPESHTWQMPLGKETCLSPSHAHFLGDSSHPVPCGCGTLSSVLANSGGYPFAGAALEPASPSAHSVEAQSLPLQHLALQSLALGN